MRRRIEGIVVHGDRKVFRCEVCGAERPYKLPMSTELFIRMGKRFLAEHKKCTRKLSELDGRIKNVIRAES